MTYGFSSQLEEDLIKVKLYRQFHADNLSLWKVNRQEYFSLQRRYVEDEMTALKLKRSAEIDRKLLR